MGSLAAVLEAGVWHSHGVPRVGMSRADVRVSMRARHGFGWRVRGEREGDERRMCRASTALSNLLRGWFGVWRHKHGWRVRQASSRSSAHLHPGAGPQAQAVSSWPTRWSSMASPTRLMAESVAIVAGERDRAGSRGNRNRSRAGRGSSLESREGVACDGRRTRSSSASAGSGSEAWRVDRFSRRLDQAAVAGMTSPSRLEK